MMENPSERKRERKRVGEKKLHQLTRTWRVQLTGVPQYSDTDEFIFKWKHTFPLLFLPLVVQHRSQHETYLINLLILVPFPGDNCSQKACDGFSALVRLRTCLAEKNDLFLKGPFHGNIHFPHIFHFFFACLHLMQHRNIINILKVPFPHPVYIICVWKSGYLFKIHSFCDIIRTHLNIPTHSAHST